VEPDRTELSPRATALAVLTLVGLSVLPALHLIVHDQLAPHEHGPSADHCHGGECHEHQDRGATKGDERSEKAPDPAHGEGSLAHQDLALAVAPIALPAIGVSRLSAADELPAPSALTDRVHRGAARARGPPLSS